MVLWSKASSYRSNDTIEGYAWDQIMIGRLVGDELVSLETGAGMGRMSGDGEASGALNMSNMSFKSCG